MCADRTIDSGSAVRDDPSVPAKLSSPGVPGARPAIDPARLRILEIGDFGHFKLVFPAYTTLLAASRRRPGEWPPDLAIDCSPRNLLRALRDVRVGRYDLVVVYSLFHAPWHPRQWLRSILHSPLRPLTAAFRVFGVQLLRFVRFDTPMIAVDLADSFGIGRHNFFLLDRAQLYFKRELPIDNWQVLYQSAHPSLPTRRIRHNARWQRRLQRLRPIALGVDPIGAAGPRTAFPKKLYDVFFAGNVDGNSTVRSRGIAELRALQERGYRIDIATEPLTKQEYLHRMSQAWLAWSPSGFGWECYRHYEAPQCLTVPVIDYPTILRHRPLEPGKHAVFYMAEPGGLTQAIETALADKDKLRQMAIDGGDFVRAHHTWRALCEAMIAAAFEASAQPAPASDSIWPPSTTMVSPEM